MTGNELLAERACAAARDAGRGLDRRTALCAAVALAETSTVPAARRALSHLDALGMPGLRQAAADLIDHLATTEKRS